MIPNLPLYIIMVLELTQVEQENLGEDADYTENIQLMQMALHLSGLKDQKLQVGVYLMVKME